MISLLFLLPILLFSLALMPSGLSKRALRPRQEKYIKPRPSRILEK